MGEQLEFTCPGCGAAATTAVTGEEFNVISIDVFPAASCGEAASQIC